MKELIQKSVSLSPKSSNQIFKQINVIDSYLAYLHRRELFTSTLFYGRFYWAQLQRVIRRKAFEKKISAFEQHWTSAETLLSINSVNFEEYSRHDYLIQSFSYFNCFLFGFSF